MSETSDSSSSGHPGQTPRPLGPVPEDVPLQCELPSTISWTGLTSNQAILWGSALCWHSLSH